MVKILISYPVENKRRSRKFPIKAIFNAKLNYTVNLKAKKLQMA